MLTLLPGQMALEIIATGIENIVKMEELNQEGKVFLDQDSTIRRKIAADVESKKVNLTLPYMIYKTCKL